MRTWCLAVPPPLLTVHALGGGHRRRCIITSQSRRCIIVATSSRDEPPPPSSEDVTNLVVTKEAFASSFSSVTLAALLSERFTAMSLSMVKSGSGALRHHASIARRRDDADRDTGVTYPPSWSLPLTLGVEVLASFLTEILSTKEIDRLRGKDTAALASLGAYVRGIRSAMSVGVPPLP